MVNINMYIRWMMPGKVNPVIPEMTAQVAMKVMANDTAISMAASNGNFELNAFLPLIADCLLESLELLCHVVGIFRVKCIESITVNEEICLRYLKASTAYAVSLTEKYGYDQVAEMVHLEK